MWCDEIAPNSSWTKLWSDFVVCGACSGIRRFEIDCPSCGAKTPACEQKITLDDGREVTQAQVFMGAEGRFEDYLYLQLMEREWKREHLADEYSLLAGQNISAKAAIVLLFWTYFETRIERIFRQGIKQLPDAFLKDFLKRHRSINERLNKGYEIAFESTYKKDLIALGYAPIADVISEVHVHRNAFAHGEPGAIDDRLVKLLVENLKLEHEAWIAVYNLRVAVRPSSATKKLP